MDELARQSELNVARETARDEAKAATMEAILAATERGDAANERQREILNRESQMLRKEIMAQANRDTMNNLLEEMSPNSKYFWISEKRDVVRMRRAKDKETSRGGSSYTDPSFLNFV
ncbi:hypothetical protein PS2_015076 [Malus domestica]